MLPKSASHDGPNEASHSPIALQGQKTVYDVSPKTPILSAKRPKKRNIVPALFPTPRNSTSSSIPHTLPRSPEIGFPSVCHNERCLTSSPMHNVRPVPKHRHCNPTAGSDSTQHSKDKTLLTGDDHLAETAVDDAIENVESASASWVGRKVDAIFSPVLSFLQAATNGSSSVHGKDILPSSNNSVPPCHGTEEKTATQNGRDNLQTEEGCCQLSSNIVSELSKPVSDHYDHVPSMNNTDTSGAHVVDADSDVRMTDYRPLVTASNETHVCEYSERHDPTTRNDETISNSNADDEEDEFNPYLFIKCLPPYQLVIPPGWSSRPKALPPLDPGALPLPPSICLVLDLDETLVHCTVEPVDNADMKFPVEFNGTKYQVHVRCRPYLQQFLQAVSDKFEVVIFTASQQVYADKLLDKIDPEGKFIHHRMFRDSCLPVEGNFLKDLTILGRDLSKAVLVDNSPHAFGYQVDNGIPIESWFDDPSDKELIKLEMFLRTLHGVDDVRDVVRKTFQTHQLVRNA